MICLQQSCFRIIMNGDFVVFRIKNTSTAFNVVPGQRYKNLPARPLSGKICLSRIYFGGIPAVLYFSSGHVRPFQDPRTACSRNMDKEFFDLLAGITITSARKNRSIKSTRHAQKENLKRSLDNSKNPEGFFSFFGSDNPQNPQKRLKN